MSDFKEVEIAELSTRIISGLSSEAADIEIKLAALKVAVATVDGAIGAKAHIAMMHNLLNPSRR